jgi:uncharacterized protein
MISSRLRIVFDTNIVVSALVFGRRLAWLRDAWSSGAAIPIVCRETVDELIRVLAYPKFALNDADRTALLGEYLPFAELAPLPRPPPRVPAACRDRSDLVFIQLAIGARADLLVTGDADLAVLRGVVNVVSPAELRLRMQTGI